MGWGKRGSAASVADALASLDPDHRAILVETYYRGRSVAEAAAALGISAETVKSRAFYALKELQLTARRRQVPHFHV